MSYAFSMADMRTYLSYLRTKKQEVLFDQAADGADDKDQEEEDEEEDKNTPANPDEKKRTSDDDMVENDVDTM